MKKHYSPKQKASIALSALRGEKISSLSSQYQIHPNLIAKWKSLAEAELESLFADRRKKENYSKDRIIDELYRTIGEREVEISWLKKKCKLELPREINFGD
jgi:transposase-like protein